MKAIEMKHLLFIAWMTLGLSFSYAQELCEREDEENPEEQCDSCEEDADDTDFNSDIGGDGDDMTVSEDDMMGTEEDVTEDITEDVTEDVVEDVTEDVAEEVTTEIATEALASAALDAIPGVGELVMAAMLIATIFESIEHMEELKAEHKLAHKLSGGNFTFPIFPSFATSAEDLNGSRDTVSYLFFIKKRIGAPEVRSYLTSMGATEHIGNAYDVSKFNNHMAYAFSTFTGNHSYSDGNVGYKYLRSIPEITLSQERGTWNYGYQATWRHSVSYNYVSGESTSLPETYEGTPVGPSTRTTTREYGSLNSHSTLDRNSPIQFWLATRNQDGSFNYLAQVPDNQIHIEDHNEQVAVRIKNFNIAPYTNRGDLFITLRTLYKENYITQIGNKVFPENWNPTLYNSQYFSKYIEETRQRFSPGIFSSPDRNIGPPEIISSPSLVGAFSDANVYPNTQGQSPSDKDGNLIYFRVHDYQPKDTPASIAQKTAANELATVNPLPVIHTLGQVLLASGTISSPDPGRTNLRIDIPQYTSGPNRKEIAYIELEALNHGHTMIISLSDYEDESCRARAYYNTKTSSNNALGVMPVRIVNGQWHASEYNAAIEFLPQAGGSKAGLFVLENVPIAPGDYVNVSTHYADGSLSRSVVVLKDVANSGGVLPRAYYTLKTGDSQYLCPAQSDNALTLSTEAQGHSAQWLIEYQGNQVYALMHKATRKALGIVDGQVGIYDWDQTDPHLYWLLQSSSGGSVKWMNIGQQAYLHVSGAGTLGFSFSQGTGFITEEASEVPPVIPSDSLYYLSNQANHKVLSIDQANRPMLAVRTNDLNNRQGHRFIYQGCLHYEIYNPDSEHYLSQSSAGLQWNAVSSTSWLPIEAIDGYFTLSTASGSTLYIENASDNTLSLSSSGIPNNDPRYEWSFSSAPGDLLAHYPLDENAENISGYSFGNGTAYGGVAYVNDNVRGRVAQFDGVDDYINTNFSYNPNRFGRHLTVSCWMKAIRWAGDETRLLEAGSWAIYGPSSTDSVSFRTRHVENEQTVARRLSSNPTLLDNQWHHIAIVIKPHLASGIGKVLYVDGVEQGSSNVDISIETFLLTNNALIGKNYYNYNGNYNGYLDDIKIWRRALSASEVLSEYQKTKKEPAVVKSYVFTGTDSDRGFYKITNRNSGKALADVGGGNVAQRTYTADHDYSDQWLIEPLPDGEYLISNRKNFKALDVQGGSQADRGNVWSYALSKGPAQRWRLSPHGEGLYQIQNAGSDKCVDVKAVSSAEGANIQQFSCKALNNKWVTAQQFVIEFVEEAMPLLDTSKHYSMRSTVASVTPDTATTWSLSYQGAQLYAFEALATRLWLTTNAATPNRQAYLVRHRIRYDERKWQRWALLPSFGGEALPEGEFKIIPEAYPAQTLQVSTATPPTLQVNPVGQSTGNWTLKEVSVPPLPSEGRPYRIKLSTTSQYVHVAGNRLSPPADIELYPYDPSYFPSYNWKFVKQPDNTYKIKLLGKKNQYLHVEWNRTNSSAQLELFSFDNNHASSYKWVLDPIPGSSNQYYIRLAGNPVQYLHTEGNATISSAQVEIYPFNNDQINSYQWVIESYEHPKLDVSGGYRLSLAQTAQYLHTWSNRTTSSTDVEIYPYSPSYAASYNWEFVRQPDNTYKIKLLNTNQYLHTYSNGTVSSTDVEVFSFNSDHAYSYYWMLEQAPGSSDEYYIKLANGSNQYLHTLGNSTGASANVEIFPFNSSTENSYRWTLNKLSTPPRVDVEGHYNVRLSSNMEQYLHTWSNRTTSSTNVEIYPYSPSYAASYNWEFVRQPDNTYKIKLLNTNQYLHTYSNGTVSSTDVEVFSFNSDHAYSYYWMLEQAPGSSDEYYIKLANGSNQYLHTSGNSTGASANVEILPFNSNTENSYRWTLTPMRSGGNRIARMEEAEPAPSSAERLLYPNPATDEVHISLPVQEDAQVQIRISDLVNKVLYTESRDVKANTSRLTLDLKPLNLRTGLYVVSIKTQAGQFEGRLLIE